MKWILSILSPSPDYYNTDPSVPHHLSPPSAGPTPLSLHLDKRNSVCQTWTERLKYFIDSQGDIKLENNTNMHQKITMHICYAIKVKIHYAKLMWWLVYKKLIWNCNLGKLLIIKTELNYSQNTLQEELLATLQSTNK